MKVYTYHPKNVERKEELAKRVAEVHAKVVVDYVKNLPLNPKEQKLLLQKIIDINMGEILGACIK
ncbi:MAG: hypothetical protein R3Y07_03910 [Eubacteriales bacterium]